MKRYFVVSLLLGLLFLAANMLSGCNMAMLTLNETATADLAAVRTYFSSNVYSQPADTDFDLNTSQNYIADENFYIMVASDLMQDVPKIKIEEITYTNGTDISLAVGNANTVTRMPYKVLNNELFVAAPLLFLNAGKDGKAYISFPSNSIMAFDVVVYETGQNTLQATLSSNTENALQATDMTNLVFNFKSDNPNNSVFVVLKNGETVLSTTDVVLIEKVANPSQSNQSVAYSFATPTTPGGYEENGIQFFPGYNSGVAYTEGTPADHVLIYNIHVVGVGSLTIKLNFENTYTLTA